MGKFVRVLTLTLAVVLIIVSNSYGYNIKNDEVIRLHVLANSNSAEDQFIKYQVRDEIIKNFSSELANINCPKQLEAFIEKNIKQITKKADNILKKNGFSYSAEVSTGKFNFPSRMYLDEVYPAGDYQAVKVELGEGAGDNWWCVMFPPLCFVGEANSPQNEAEKKQTTLKDKDENNEIEYSIKIIDIFKSLLGKITNISS
ncbi:stage II sporulation protein R [Proteinivorax tanatarense]|uniref:Stage II sporulation protein R n=1 Tax=Proteinivorax tanatarense TaxID=1260629 RepID=A0AAU7VL82_9FIRM